MESKSQVRSGDISTKEPGESTRCRRTLRRKYLERGDMTLSLKDGEVDPSLEVLLVNDTEKNQTESYKGSCPGT